VDMTYRFRFLIYLAAFMLLMSVCFVYAEPLPSGNHLLFQSAPQHAGFLSSATSEPSFDPAALRSATTPMVSPALLQELEVAAHPHHGLLHRSRHTRQTVVPANTQSETSVVSPVISPAASR
jgi:hypothetical protein